MRKLLLTILMLLVFNPSNAIEITGTVSILSMTDLSGDCGQTPYADDENYQPAAGLFFQVNATDIQSFTEDAINSFGYSTDWWWIVIFDAYGYPIAGTRYGMTVGQTWQNAFSGAAALTFVDAWSAPQARPFVAKVYDTDVTNYDPTWIWEVTEFPELATSAPFDPGGACDSLPIGDIDNFIAVPVPRPVEVNGITPAGTALAIYEVVDGLDFYGVDAESNGFYITSLAMSEVPLEIPLTNQLIKQVDTLSIWYLTSGEVQVNYVNVESKTFVYIFSSGLSLIDSYVQ